MKILFPKSLAVWQTPAFETVFKQELRDLDKSLLPLQAALSQSSHVSETAIDPLVLQCRETDDAVLVKIGIFFSGIIAGSCCADDPTPISEQTEYCELLCTINKSSAEASFSLVIA